MTENAMTGGPPSLALRLETSMLADDLRAHLAKWAPWNSLIEFSNGVTTAEFERVSPFADSPLYKITHVEPYVPFESLRGGAVLDIGCNAGYNSIYLATKYDLRPVGVDVQQRLIDAANFLSSLAGVEAEFLIAHADSFVRTASFDVVAHFGTLYHLQNPLRSLQSAYETLKPGGYLALETQCYDDPDDERFCYFIHGLNDDPSNFFALSTSTIRTCLALLGFEEPEECFRDQTRVGARDNMFRVGLVARKGERAKDLGTEWPPWSAA
jgi:SAM-dependent methyltransferase